MGKSAKGIDGVVTTVKAPADDISWTEIVDRPTIPAAQVQSDWNASSGSGEILNKPTIPSNTNQLTNGNGFITSSSLTWDNVTGKPTIPTNNNQLTNGNGYITLSDVTWSNTSGKPNFANVATSGSYNDLSDKPTPIILTSDYPVAPFAIDLTKQLATIGNGTFTMANGVENQIIYLALTTGNKSNCFVTFASLRTDQGGVASSNVTVRPFQGSAASARPTAVFCIFTNGAWTISNGDL